MLPPNPLAELLGRHVDAAHAAPSPRYVHRPLQPIAWIEAPMTPSPAETPPVPPNSPCAKCGHAAAAHTTDAHLGCLVGWGFATEGRPGCPCGGHRPDVLARLAEGGRTVARTAGRALARSLRAIAVGARTVIRIAAGGTR